MSQPKKILRIKECLRHTNEIAVFCACSLFLISALFPFLTIVDHSFMHSSQVTYWSCKTRVISLSFGTEETYWFTDYWFAPMKIFSYQTPVFYGVSWALVAMSLMQTLTLGSVYAILYLHKKLTKLFPFISCLSVIFIMTYVIFRVQSLTYHLLEYELGYWLCYPSAILFLLAFLLNHRTESISNT